MLIARKIFHVAIKHFEKRETTSLNCQIFRMRQNQLNPDQFSKCKGSSNLRKCFAIPSMLPDYVYAILTLKLRCVEACF